MADGERARVERKFTRAQVETAINQAADMAWEWVGRGDDGSRDLVNLVVNVTLERLDGRGRSVPAVVRRCYGEAPATVQGWCLDG
jgi:hypothetical protein